MNKTERPPMGFDQATVDEICERIAEGEALAAICKDDHIPCYSIIMKWLRGNETFVKQYARAREDQADTIYCEIIDVEKQLKDGKIDPSTARVLGDLKRWRAARMKPKVYGDHRELRVSAKIDQEHGLDDPMDQAILDELSNKRRLLPDDDVQGVNYSEPKQVEHNPDGYKTS